MTITLRDATREVSSHTWPFISDDAAGVSLPTPFFDKYRNIYIQELQIVVEVPPVAQNNVTMDLGDQDDPTAYVSDLEIVPAGQGGYTFIHIPLGGFIVLPGRRLHVRLDIGPPTFLFSQFKACYEDYGNPPCWDGQ